MISPAAMAVSRSLSRGCRQDISSCIKRLPSARFIRFSMTPIRRLSSASMRLPPNSSATLRPLPRSHTPQLLPSHRHYILSPIPDTDSPPPTTLHRGILAPTPLTPPRYHQLADHTFDTMLQSLEDLADSQTPGDGGRIQDVEYSQGVLTVVVEDKGTWVVNKQPPNSQIWWSSPLSGPRRFDWVEERGGWVCLREGEECGLGLGELVKREWGEGVEVGEGWRGDIEAE